MQLDFDYRWIDAGESVDRLSAATMAELKITVGDFTLTSHIDRQTHARSISAPLYPIAEWLAAWWWPLFHEHGEWDVSGNADYLARHDLAFAAPGFALPSAVLQPTGRFLDIRASRSSPIHSPVEFLTEGRVSVPLSEAQTCLSDLITGVIEQLRSAGIHGTTLQEDWEAIAGLDREEMDFSQLAGAFGLDPFDTNEHVAEAIARIADSTEPSLQEDLFSLAPPGDSQSVLDSIHTACRDLDQQDSPRTWTDLATRTPSAPSDRPPWQVGYQAAQWVRRELGLNGQPVKLEEGLEVPALDLAVLNERLAGIVSSKSPACAVKAQSAPARRFARARSVGDFLLRSTSGPTLLTTMRTDRQAQSRSFAAELLAPSHGLRERLGDQSRWIDSDTIDDLAGEFDVSSLVVSHQIENHKLGRVAS